MDFSELIKIRQSQRRYDTSREVESAKIDACIEAARLAPSATNSQPWKFVVVDSPETVSEAASYAAATNPWIKEAKAIVAVVLEKSNFLSSLGSVLQNKEYRLIDIGIATDQFCLQAAELGLGTCIVGMFNESGMKKLLGVPRSKRIPLIIAVGYPASPVRPKIRKATEEMSSRNRY